MYRFGYLVIAATFLIAGSALASEIDAKPPAGPVTSNRTLNITGVEAIVDPGSACAGDSWISQCSGTCSCAEITVSKASGSMDKGIQSVSNFFITIEDEINPATEPAVPPGPTPACHPFLAELTDTSSTQSKTLNLVGVLCRKVAITKKNPSGTQVGQTITGGWGISNNPVPSPDASGWGTMTGSTIDSTKAVSIKISGLVTE
jgi:hypothetical protein